MRGNRDPQLNLGSRLSLRARGLAAILILSLAGTACGRSEDDGFRGGCEKFAVYAQNRWDPRGTAVRAEPDVLATKLEPSFAPNEVIAVDGWIETNKPVYPTNPEPWNSGRWLRVANRAGWVSFAGVRGAPTSYDPTGLSEDGGPPAPTPPECEVSYAA